MSWQNTLQSFRSVVITGGSSGIGAELINTLNKLSSRSVIINLSRSKPAIFSGSFTIEHIPTDLADASSLAAGAESVKERLAELPEGPVLLINNAGFGNYGEFATEGQDEIGMIGVNVLAVIDLTQRLLPAIKARGGWIVTVSSVAGFQPTPYLATYGAAKAFVLHWSLALNEELRGSGVRTLAVCPGPTKSAFFKRAGFKVPPNAVKGQMPREVVIETFQALHRGKALVVTGRSNRIMTLSTHFFSKALIAKISKMIMKRFRLDEKKRSHAA